MNQLLGLQRSKLSNAGMRGRRSYMSSYTGPSSLDNSQTIVTTGADQVAVIDYLDIPMLASQASGATNKVVTVTIAGMTMKFAINGSATVNRAQRYLLKPKGTMIVPPSSSMSAVCDTTTFQGSIGVKYRMMSRTEATSQGFYASEFWCASSGTIAVAGTAQSITGFAAADVGTKRYLEINGIAITGGMSSATSAAPLEILLEFTDGTATHRKVIKGCYTSSDPDVTPPTIINNCVIRGPVGYGLRVTAGQTGVGAQIALWGKYGSTDAKTFPGTGVAPGATDALDAKEYFWVFSEATALGVTEIFPATTVSGKKTPYSIDGYAFGITAPGGAGGILAIGGAVTFANYSPTCVNPLGAAGVGGANVMVDDEADMKFRLSDRVGLAVVPNGTVSKVSQLVWGRCGGTFDQNALSDTYLTKTYTGGVPT